ncbi:hypothetical protein [Winogradskyella sp.]|uniref:hypothetical protein n=1 Tax=Winogradskyella sp. TaxID=1883156 RepID=UPI003BA9261F
MKTTKLLFAIMFVLTSATVTGQSQKQLEREKNKVHILTDEERANLQLLFYDKTKAMNLSEDTEEAYYRYFFHYVYDMQRLNDKDQDYNKEDMKKEFRKLVTKMDARMAPILTDEQFKMYKENWNAIMKVVHFKNGR